MSTEREGKSTVFQAIVSSVTFFGTVGLVILLMVTKKKPKEQDDTRQAPAVEYVSIEPFTGDIKINVTGITMPYREITIAAEVTGAITLKTDDCQSGRYVDGGKHLLSIDSEKYQLKLNRLESEITEAEAKLERIKAELKTAEQVQLATDEDFQTESREWKKREKLYEANAISETEWNQSRRNFNAAKNAKTNQDGRVSTLNADVKAQTSLVELKRVQKKEAKIDFDNAIINSPTKGVVISDDVEENDFVQVGQKLLVFEDTSAVEVKCDLRSDQLQSILESAPRSSNPEDQFKLPPLVAKIKYEANTRTFLWTGKLDRYDGLGLDEVTRTAPCRILVTDTLSKPKVEGESENENESKDNDTKKDAGISKEHRRTLVRGMYVSVELNLKSQPGLLAIPAEALRAGNYVWVYVPDSKQTGKLSKREIRVVNRIYDEKTKKEIVIAKSDPETIQEGELLITSPIPQPIDGMELRKADKPSETSEPDSQSEMDSEAGQSIHFRERNLKELVSVSEASKQGRAS